MKDQDVVRQILTEDEFSELSAWIQARPNGFVFGRGGPFMEHSCYWLVARVLTQCGVSLEELTAYALSQVVVELYKGDQLADHLEGVAAAYAVAHTTGVGPASKSIVMGVRDGYRR